jgi:hypothetical protein
VDPDDQRHAAGVAAGRKIEIEPLPPVCGSAVREMAIRLITMRGDAGVTERGRQRGVGLKRRYRALVRR